MKKTVVIGLDGAAWHLIDPWIENGELPNFKFLKDQGCWGDLDVSLPPVTSPNWKCYSTGKNPGKFGVFWWEVVDKVQKKIISGPPATSYRSREFWDYLSDEGLKVGVINMPTTYPPHELNGFMISGGASALGNDYTYPIDLQKKIEDDFGYKVFPTSAVSTQEGVNDCYEMFKQRFKVAKYLLEKENVDFLHLTLFYLNILHHFYYKSNEVLKGWKIVDDYLRWFIEKSYNVILMSDHGLAPINVVFYINRWLTQKGYLKFNEKIAIGKAKGIAQKLGINKENLLKLTGKLRLTSFLRKITPTSLIKSLPEADGCFRHEAHSSLLDWEKSKVYASGQGPIYLLNIENEEERKRIKGELETALLSIRYNDNDSEIKIISKIHEGDDIYNGDYTSLAPDLIAEYPYGVHINGGLGGTSIFEKPKKWVTSNARPGIFLFYGEGFKIGEKVKPIKIFDLAPAIMHLYGLPKDSDMDGEVPPQIFKADSEYAQRKTGEKKYKGFCDPTQTSEEGEKEIKKRLQNLGYLD
ncbi:alkaline phosphatase family protein [bacterium]|nr:alkaline phosphatase family protein [bacterium]